MWDGREPSLQSQFVMQLWVMLRPRPSKQRPGHSGREFRTGLFTAQNFSNQAGNLSSDFATGGPVNLSKMA